MNEMKKHAVVMSLLAAVTAMILMSDRPAAADDQSKGTGTCHKQDGGKRTLLRCWEKVTREEGRKLCYNGEGGDTFHFQSPGPTCFAIINGDINWP